MNAKLKLCTQTAMVALLIGADAAAAKVAAATANPDVIETVTVTALKRATTLETTPVAITALSSDALAKQHVETVQDLVHLVPSFQATSEGDHGVVTLTLRGIGNDSAKTEYADPEVSIYIDGVYSPRAEGAAALLFDLDRVEVLRGPQGTLWGRNSTAGTVNIVTAKPEFDSSSADLEIGTGDYARASARGAANVPLTDTWAVRLSFAQERHDGYVDYQNPDPQLPSLPSQQAAYVASGGSLANFKPINPNLFVQSGQKYSAQDQSALRLSSLWEPTSQFTWDISFEYFRDRGTLDANLMQNPRPGEQFWSTLADVAPYLHRDVYSIRSRMDYNINDYMNLAYIAGFGSFRGDSDFAQDGGTHIPTSFATGATFQEDRTNYSHYTNWSQELELQSSGNHEVDWILGAYYGNEDNSIRFDIPIFNGTSEGTVAWQGSFIQPKETVETKALFAQATWNITSALHLTAGGRYSWDDKANDGGTNNAWNYNAACPQVPLDPGTNPLTDTACFHTYQKNTAKYSDSEPTFLLRAQYDFSSDFMTYASVSSGYKSGGLQDGGLSFKPEILTSYEVGTKNTLFDGSVTLNNAAFYYSFRDYQLAAPVTFPDGSHGLDFWNVKGTTTDYGFESELDWLLTEDDHLQPSLSLLHTQLGTAPYLGSNDYSNLPPCANKQISACVNATGHALPHAPSAAVTLQYEHEFHLANSAVLEPRVTTHWESSSWLSPLHDGSGDKQGSYTRTDLGLRYTSASAKQWYVEAYVQNVEDGRIRTNAGATSDNIYTSQYLPPRTYGINFGIGF